MYARAEPDTLPSSGVRNLSPEEHAVLRTLVYADVFDWPLNRDELHAFCMAPAGSRAALDVALSTLTERRIVDSDGSLFFLACRDACAENRRQQEGAADVVWRQAHFWGAWIWALPFVRMVAVTGSLAAGSVTDSGDIDFLIVTEPERLWLTRAMCCVLWRLARLSGARLCPNFLLATRALVMEQRDEYAARELAQMAPLHGWATAARLWAANSWVEWFLPNAALNSSRLSDVQFPVVWVLKRLAEQALRGEWIDRIEAWECRRKSVQLAREVAGTSESQFTADVCKHHARAHGEQVLSAYALRLADVYRHLEVRM